MFDKTRDREQFDHESYGVIGIHHISTSHQPLFGSSLKHRETIRIKISRATMERHLNSDWVFEKEPLIEVDLSYSQFTEFITTSNRGTGIPCTIRTVNNQSMSEPPFQSKRDQHKQEFQKSTAGIGSKLDAIYDTVAAMLERPTVTKQERRELLEAIRYTRQCIISDLPFAVAQFNEQVEQSIQEAKGEIEGFALRRTILAGMDALRSELLTPTLLELEDVGHNSGPADVGAPSAGGDLQDAGDTEIQDTVLH